MHWEQDNCLFEEVIGRENWETIVFKIDKERWPSRECHEKRDVFGLDEVIMATALGSETGHS